MKFHSAPPEHWTPRSVAAPPDRVFRSRLSSSRPRRGWPAPSRASVAIARCDDPADDLARSAARPVHDLPVRRRDSAVPFLLGRPVERLVGAGKVRGAARDRLGIEPADRTDVAADAHAFDIAHPDCWGRPQARCRPRRRPPELGPPPAEQRAQQRQVACPEPGRWAASPPRPRTPAPRLRRMTKVSAWSSAWWAVASASSAALGEPRAEQPVSFVAGALLDRRCRALRPIARSGLRAGHRAARKRAPPSPASAALSGRKR